MSARPILLALGLGLFCAPLAGGPAWSQTPQADRPELLRRLDGCRKITEDRARLACYDGAAAALDQAEAKGEIVVVDRDRANKVRRQAFGFSLPSLDIFDRPARAAGEPRPEALSRLSAVLARAYQRGDSKWVFELEDGAIWIQTDSESLRRGADKGDKVEIRKAAVGSYFMNVDGQRALRVQRSR